MPTKKTQLLGVYAMLTYIFITFPINARHIHGSSENSLAYVNVFHACLLVSPGGHQGSSDEGSYSSSRCPLVDLCFCTNSVLRSHTPCPSRLLCYVLWSLCSLLISVVCASALPRRSCLKGLFRSLLPYNLPNYWQRTKTCFCFN